MVKIIVAFDRLRVIGQNNMLPWRLPEDMRLFRERTMGQAVIMGRKTWESLQNAPKPLYVLPGRTNYVITSDPVALAERVQPLLSENQRFYPVTLEQMFSIIDRTNGRASDFATPELPADYWVIGGERIYEEFLKADKVSRVVATEVDGEHAGDAFFPQLPPDDWGPMAMANYQGFKVVEYHRDRTRRVS